ncbi:hypothetical protein GQ42DRAFT_120900 [Ramicandelaber brevisporus]|nr:hypothetical protein GQ42DRAFT_120900 [Ramicandelaber brevisporus]
MVSASLELLKACFGYDFLGLNPDESGDEGTALHFPKEWKGLVQTDDFITLFADGYISAGPPLSTEFAHVLGQIASIRRTFFDEDFRTKHYLKILTWLTKVFSEGVWLDDQSCYHEVVRVVARLRAHYTFSDIEDKPEYAAFLEAFGRLSVRSMSLWSWSPQTLLYHLKFWSIVCGTRSLPQSIAPIIKRTSEALFNRYVSEMLNTVPGYVDGSSGEDYPLLGEEALLDQLHMIGQIARCAAALNGNAILNLLNETINLYHNAVVQGVSDPNPRIVEERLAWVIYIASAYLFNRAPYNVTEEEDAMDAKMIVKVFELQNLVGQRVAVFGTPGLEHLELASLQFFNQVRLTYLGDHVSRSSKMYKHLAEDAPGLNSVQSIYNTILTFIINSLFRWPPGSRLVSNTLSIFDGLTIGFGTLRQVAPLDQTKLLLQNHSDPQILFLNSSIKNKDRLRYYAALTRCLFNEEPSNEVFDSFVAPFDRELCLLAEMSDAEFAQQSVAIRLINIFRSLRGVLIYMLSKRGFVMFFEWFFTTYSPVIFRAMSAWAANPQVATSILKYVSEFMQNRSQRLAFDVASANGILMFREASKYIWIYGQYVHSGTKSADGDIYVRYYKPMYVCMEILQRALNGRYVAFGVFPLYGDDTLDRSFSTALAMVSTIPTAELLAYPKVCRAAFNLLEAATTESMLSVLSIDTQTYTTILTACIEGIRLGGAHSAMAHIFNVNTSTSACTVLDHLATYMINRQHAIQRQQRHASSTSPASARPDLLRRALCTIIDYAFFEENFTEWHMGRTMFALLILFNNEQCGQLYMQRIIEAQLPSRRDLASKTIGLLFKDINVPALTSPNREKFQSNFSAFRRELDAQGLVLSPPLSSVADGIVAGISASDAPPMLQNSMSFVA